MQCLINRSHYVIQASSEERDEGRQVRQEVRCRHRRQRLPEREPGGKTQEPEVEQGEVDVH